MTSDPDPFEEGQAAARKNIPAEANPYQDGSEQHSLWAAGHEEAAGEIEAVGAGVPNLKPGQRVAALGSKMYAEYALAPAAQRPSSSETIS